MEKIVTLTLNPAIDKSTTVKSIVPDKKLRCASPKFEPGGGGTATTMNSGTELCKKADVEQLYNYLKGK